MKDPISDKAPKKRITSYYMSPCTIALAIKEAKKRKTSASRLVEAILRERLAKEEGKCR